MKPAWPVFLGTGLLAALLVGAFFWNSSFIAITPPMLTVPVVITENGTITPQSSIHRVEFQFSDKPSSNVDVLQAEGLQEAPYRDGYYIAGASFTILRQGRTLAGTKVEPEYRSLLLRVTFADGRVLALVYPVLSSTDLSRPVYLDLAGWNR